MRGRKKIPDDELLRRVENIHPHLYPLKIEREIYQDGYRMQTRVYVIRNCPVHGEIRQRYDNVYYNHADCEKCSRIGRR